MKSGIYTITNLINGKIYVGFTNNLIRREKEHYRNLLRGCHKNPILQSAYDKYGKNNLIYEVLEECNVELLASQENYWCNMLNTTNRQFGYNIRFTHPNNNSRISLESRIKMSRAKHERAKLRGYYYSKEELANLIRSRQKPVLQFDKYGNLLKEWASAKLAFEVLGVDPSAISKCCKRIKNFNTAGGYVWKFKDGKLIKEITLEEIRNKLKV